MIFILSQVFLVAFLINLLWEILHSQLYETCLKISLKKYIPLIIGASLKDGFWVSLFYTITVLIFKNFNILINYIQLLVFVITALIFSFIDEKISLKMKRWHYSGDMPKIFGVGVTPLLEIAVTGILTFILVFSF